MSRVLVTGASSWEGVRLIDRLQHDREVIAVDEYERQALPVPLHRIALDTLEFAHFVLGSSPSIIVHLATDDRSHLVGRSRSRETVILGSQALFSAAERLTDLEHIVVRSEGHVYGSGNRRGLIAREEERPAGQAARHSRAMREVETLARNLGVTKGIPVAILRSAESVGPSADTALARFLRLPIIPVLWGFDPLLQLLDPDDLRDSYLHALDQRLAGVFNVAPPDPLYLSQVLRLGHIRAQRLPKPQLDAAYRLLARGGLAMPTQVKSLLRHGRVLHDASLAASGFSPRHSTRMVATNLAGCR